MASWGGLRKGGGSSRLSKLVTNVRSSPEPAKAVEFESRASRDPLGDAEAPSDEEEGGAASEDEEEVLRNATPFDEEDDRESILSQKVLFEAQALGNFQAEESGDLSFKEREILTILESDRGDGWLLAQNALGERGLVPSNYVKQLSPFSAPSRALTPAGDPSSVTPRRGRDLWSKLRQTVKQTTLADVLSALGAIPSGFRDSTMSQLLRNSSAYLTSSWIMPHPSVTGVAFKDLKWHHMGDHLLPMPTKISHEVAILMARKIPLPGKGVNVLSRHIRVAVFNKNDILSNIHSVRAVWSPQDEKTWKFSSKSQTANNSLFHQTCTVRVDSYDTNLELLFELGISFQREKTGEKGEISCGWSSLPLYDQTGSPTASKTYELKVHGGTPFESGVELDASNIKASGGGLLPSIMQARQNPRLYVRLGAPSRSRKPLYSLLPPTLITPTTYAQAIACFRHSVGVSCLRGRLGLPLPTSLVKPSLNLFLKAIDQPDVMDTTLGLLQERLKLAKRGSKNLGFISEQLEHVLLQQIYPLLYSVSFPAPSTPLADEATERERLKVIERFGKRTDLSALLASDNILKTVEFSEQIFSISPLSH